MSGIQHDNSSNTTSTSSYFNSFSWTHTTNIIDNTILVVGISWRNIGSGTETISSVTYNNNTLTLIRKDEYFNSSSKSTALYYITNPNSGVNTIQVTFNGTIYRAVGGAVSLTGVNLNNPVNVHAGQAGGTGYEILTNITPTKSSTWLIDVINGRDNDSNVTPNANQTERWDFLNTSRGIVGAGSTKLQLTPQSVSMGWTLDKFGEGWSHSIVAISPFVNPNTNFYKVEQLTEQSTVSTTFENISGTTLTFIPNSISEIWMIFVSGVCRSSNTSEQSMEMRLLIGEEEKDLWSHQNATAATPNGAGFLIFDRITGVNVLQTIKVQFRAIYGTCYADNIRVIVARVPNNADFQYHSSDAITATTGSNIIIETFAFTPISSGNYIILGSVKHREYPGGSTSQAWFESVGDGVHPNAPNETYYSNARDAWNPLTCVWRDNWSTNIQTINIRFTSSNSGTQSSEHQYRKIMIFKEDAWTNVDYSIAATQTTTTSTNFVSKNSLTTSIPPVASDYLSFQCARISGTDTGGNIQKSGELRIGGTTMVRTNHRINRDGSASQGYHHIIGLVDARNESGALTYDNGFLSPNAGTVQCAESVIVVLRYLAEIKQTHQIMM